MPSIMPSEELEMFKSNIGKNVDLRVSFDDLPVMPKRYVVNGCICFYDYEGRKIKVSHIGNNFDGIWYQPEVLKCKKNEFLVMSVDPSQSLIAIAYTKTIESSQSHCSDQEIEQTIYVAIEPLYEVADCPMPKHVSQELEFHWSDLSLEQKLKLKWKQRRNLTWDLKIFKRHIALVCRKEGAMGLKICDWEQKTMCEGMMVNTRDVKSRQSFDCCFLEDDQFLIVGDHLKFYSIQDSSKEPQLLATFMLDIATKGVECFLPMGGITHGDAPLMSHQQIAPKHQILTLCLGDQNLTYFIFTQAFEKFSSNPEIPWTRWGPQNSYIYKNIWSTQPFTGVEGNKVVLVVNNKENSNLAEYHMIIFNTSVVESQEEEEVQKCLPHTEVISDIKISAQDRHHVWVFNGKIHFFKEGYYKACHLEIYDLNANLESQCNLYEKAL